MRAREAVPHLIAAADGPANANVSRACADALGRIGGEEATAALARWLRDPARDDLRLACVALA
jgi:HEAT repeat protein